MKHAPLALEGQTTVRANSAANQSASTGLQGSISMSLTNQKDQSNQRTDRDPSKQRQVKGKTQLQTKAGKKEESNSLSDSKVKENRQMESINHEEAR